jgi:hypothetical protein
MHAQCYTAHKIAPTTHAIPANGISINMKAYGLALLLPVIALTAAAQAPLTDWSSDDLKLQFSYPSDLTKSDPAQAMQDGHLTLLGITNGDDPSLAAATRCLRPKLLLKHAASATDKTTSTILLAELDISCLTPQQQADSTDLLGKMADLVTKAPSMSSTVQPATYTVGQQNIHMAAAQGKCPIPGANPPEPQQVYTMGFATNSNNHLLVWYISSTSVDALNRLTKSTVRFGRTDAAPLYPNQIGNSGTAH